MPLLRENAQTFRKESRCQLRRKQNFKPIFFFILIVCHQIAALKRKRARKGRKRSEKKTDTAFIRRDSPHPCNLSRLAMAYQWTEYVKVDPQKFWTPAKKWTFIFFMVVFIIVLCITFCFLIFWSSTNDCAFGGSTLKSGGDVRKAFKIQIFHETLKKYIWWRKKPGSLAWMSRQDQWRWKWTVPLLPDPDFPCEGRC